MGGLDAGLNALVRDEGFVEPEEFTAAVLFLASDEARQVTGVDLPVDAGFALHYSRCGRAQIATTTTGRRIPNRPSHQFRSASMACQ